MVLLHGVAGYVHLISAENAGDRNDDIDLSTGRTSDVNDVAWHPRGNTALLVGDGGLAMRYDTYDHSITNVNGTFAVIGQTLTAVVWRPSGDFAYVAADDGSVWKFAEHTGFERLNNTGTSSVTDLACHRNHNICFIGTVDDGLAVIDQGHAVRWMAQSASETWVGLDCVDPNLNECTAYASGLRSKVINVNILEPGQSTVGSTFLVDLLEGEQTGVSPVMTGHLWFMLHRWGWSAMSPFPTACSPFWSRKMRLNLARPSLAEPWPWYGKTENTTASSSRNTGTLWLFPRRLKRWIPAF